MKISNLRYVRKNDNIKLRMVANKYYLFGNGQCLETNEIGAIIWKYLGNEVEINEFAKKVSKKYEYQNIDGIIEDTLKYIGFLSENHLVQVYE